MAVQLNCSSSSPLQLHMAPGTTFSPTRHKQIGVHTYLCTPLSSFLLSGILLTEVPGSHDVLLDQSPLLLGRNEFLFWFKAFHSTFHGHIFKTIFLALVFVTMEREYTSLDFFKSKQCFRGWSQKTSLVDRRKATFWYQGRVCYEASYLCGPLECNSLEGLGRLWACVTWSECSCSIHPPSLAKGYLWLSKHSGLLLRQS